MPVVISRTYNLTYPLSSALLRINNIFLVINSFPFPIFTFHLYFMNYKIINVVQSSFIKYFVRCVHIIGVC